MQSKGGLEKLTSSTEILSLARAIEERYGGNSTGIDILPIETRGVAACRAEWSAEEERWYIMYTPESPPHDHVLCHELMHIILFIEGFPGACFSQWLTQRPWHKDMAYRAFNLCHHLEVWPLCESFGFSQEEYYSGVIATEVAPAVGSRNFFERLGPRQGDIQRFYHCCESLLSPASNDSKNALWAAIKKGYPQLLEPVQEYCAACCERLPLTPESFMSAANMLFGPLNLPPGSVTLETYYYGHLTPNFRKVVLGNRFGI